MQKLNGELERSTATVACGILKLLLRGHPGSLLTCAMTASCARHSATRVTPMRLAAAILLFVQLVACALRAASVPETSCWLGRGPGYRAPADREGGPDTERSTLSTRVTAC